MTQPGGDDITWPELPQPPDGDARADYRKILYQAQVNTAQNRQQTPSRADVEKATAAAVANHDKSAWTNEYTLRQTLQQAYLDMSKGAVDRSDYVRYEPLDHVNIHFTDRPDTDPATLLDDVLDVFNKDSWGTGMQGHLYLEERAGPTLRRERAWRTKDKVPPAIWRYHVRLWRGVNMVLGLAHREHVGLWPLTDRRPTIKR